MPPNAFLKHPTKHKIAEIHTYAYRAINIWSDINSPSKEIIYLKSILKMEYFNPSIIYKDVNKFLNFCQFHSCPR